MFALVRDALSRELLATAAIGLILVGLGTPRLLAAVAAAPAGAGDLARNVDRDAAALRWRRSGGALKQLGLAQHDLAEKAGAGAIDGGGLRRAARQNLEAGLALAPADPTAWAALAGLDFGENGASDRAPRALELSLLTGPNEPDLLWTRIDLGFAMWPSLADSARALMTEQLRRAWERDPAKLVGLARRNAAADAVRAALADQPDAVARFNTLLDAG